MKDMVKQANKEREDLMVDLKEKVICFSSLASKPINIQWIRFGFQPYLKILYSIEVQTIYHEN